MSNYYPSGPMPGAAPGPMPFHPPRKIGLWGASSSGKTTFLAALYVAVTQSRGSWNLVGADQDSVDFLTGKTGTLTQARRFPEKSEGIQHLSWTLVGQTERTVGGRFRKRVEAVPLQIQLDMIDAAGGLFKGEDRAAADASDDLGFDDDFEETMRGGESQGGSDSLIDQLAECHGLVYLFDPLREHDRGDEFQHFQWALQELSHRSMRNGTFSGTRLPHFLAVCITKFDDPKVFQTARRRNYLTYDPEDPMLLPRVREDCAEELFCDLARVSPTGSAMMVHDCIGKSFHPERVKYFASSSVGFHIAQSATRFREADFQNVIPDRERGYTIRGRIRPINVLEPLLWLGRSVEGR